MATLTQPFLRSTSYEEHEYHAEADVLSGHLFLPVNQEIRKQAPSVLEDRREGHFFQRAEPYSLEGLITFKSGYTHVSGSRSLKKPGWITLATSVLEGLNVLDVITADRMVAQVSTEHPEGEDRHVPHVTFLGTRFENLRVGGYEVNLQLDLGICGNKPDHDTPYTEDLAFLNRVQQQCSSIAGAVGLPSTLQAEYDKELKTIGEFKDHCNGSGNGKPRKLACSLIKSIAPIPVAKVFGNVLEIPGFGIVTLAEVEVGSTPPYDPSMKPDVRTKFEAGNYFELTMLKMRMGCIGDGKIKAVNAKSNGNTAP